MRTMLLDKYGEYSAPGQTEPTGQSVRDTALTRGVLGAEPPPESDGAAAGKREMSAAGFHSIYETFRHGGRMGVTRSLKTLTRINQKEGFDCPGCAWPDPDDERKRFEFCENGVKAVASEATLRRATPDFFAQHGIAEMLEQSDYWLEKQGRITHPMLLDANSNHYVPIAWDDAFALIARKLNALASPDEAAFYTSGRASNESAFLYGLFARQFGTNNLPDCSNMCLDEAQPRPPDYRTVLANPAVPGPYRA